MKLQGLLSCGCGMLSLWMAAAECAHARAEIEKWSKAVKSADQKLE